MWFDTFPLKSEREYTDWNRCLMGKYIAMSCVFWKYFIEWIIMKFANSELVNQWYTWSGWESHQCLCRKVFGLKKLDCNAGKSEESISWQPTKACRGGILPNFEIQGRYHQPSKKEVSGSRQKGFKTSKNVFKNFIISSYHVQWSRP